MFSGLKNIAGSHPACCQTGSCPYCLCHGRGPTYTETLTAARPHGSVETIDVALDELGMRPVKASNTHAAAEQAIGEVGCACC